MNKIKSDVYSPYKAAKYMDKIEQLKKGELITPTFVQLDPTNVCNLNCSFCFYRQTWDENQKLKDWDADKMIPSERLMSLLDEFKDMGIEGIELTGGGSAECHPTFDDFVVKAHEMGFNLALVTNGTLLNLSRLQLLIDFDWVRFSVDAANSKTWMDIKGMRDPDMFNCILERIRNFVKIKQDKCVVGLSMIICDKNYKEIYEFAKMAKDIGVENVRFSLAHVPNAKEMFDPIWDECVKLMEKAKTLEDNKFRVFIFKNRIYELRAEFGAQPCPYQEFVAVITPTGVYPCCLFKARTEYNLGDINKQSFKEIWYGEKRKKFVDRCKKFGCTGYCWMREKNNFIQYLIDKDVPHRCFI